MLICPHCGYQNRPGMLFCEDCGRSLEDANIGENAARNPTIPTRRMQDDPDESVAKSTWGSARVGDATAISVHFKYFENPLNLSPASRIVFGRSDTSNLNGPDVDLTPFGALEKGVSRQHAVIEFSEDTLMLMDIGSSNGTYLNGQRLPPNQPRVLRDGDEMRLGKLVAHVYFT